MNPHTSGALEGLAYALSVLDKHFDKHDEGPILDAYAEIEATELKILAGTTWAFKARVDLDAKEPRLPIVLK